MSVRLSDLKPQESLLLGCVGRMGGHISPKETWPRAWERAIAIGILDRLAARGLVFGERGGFTLSTDGLGVALEMEAERVRPPQ